MTAPSTYDDNEIVNASSNLHMDALIATRLSRRQALKGGMSVTPRPCAEKTLATVTGGSAEPSKLKTLPSEWRVTEPASPAVKLTV